MKRRDLIRAIEDVGFVFVRHGAKHDIYGRESQMIAVPRHKEIEERLAAKILKEAGVA